MERYFRPLAVSVRAPNSAAASDREAETSSTEDARNGEENGKDQSDESGVGSTEGVIETESNDDVKPTVFRKRRASLYDGHAIGLQNLGAHTIRSVKRKFYSSFESLPLPMAIGTRRYQTTVERNSTQVTDCRFDRYGYLLASCHSDGRVHVYDVSQHCSQLRKMQTSEDDPPEASSANMKCLYDASCVQFIDINKPLRCLRWRPSNQNQILVGVASCPTSMPEILQFDLQKNTSTPIQTFRNPAHSRIGGISDFCIFSPPSSSREVVAGAGKDGRVRIWDIRKGSRPQKSFSENLQKTSVAIDNMKGSPLLYVAFRDGSISTYDIRMGLLRTCRGMRNWILPPDSSDTAHFQWKSIATRAVAEGFILEPSPDAAATRLIVQFRAGDGVGAASLNPINGKVYQWNHTESSTPTGEPTGDASSRSRSTQRRPCLLRTKQVLMVAMPEVPVVQIYDWRNSGMLEDAQPSEASRLLSPSDYKHVFPLRSLGIAKVPGIVNAMSAQQRNLVVACAMNNRCTYLLGHNGSSSI